MGLPKTGSTALQRGCGTNRDRLLEHGILYPQPTRGHVHNLLLCHMLPDERYPTLVADNHGDLQTCREAGAREYQALLERSDRGDITDIVLSSENVGTRLFRAEDYAALAAALRELSAEITPLFYVREPAAHYLSYLQQGLKSSVIPRKPHPMQMRGIYDAIAEGFGQAPLVRCFARDQLVNGDILDDFFATFLPGRLEVGEITAERDNETLSAEGMIVLNHIRATLAGDKDGHRDELTNMFISLIREAEAIRPTTKPRLTERVRDAIIAASDELLWLRDELGVSFTDVDYGRISGTPIPPEIRDLPLEELFSVDEAKCDQLAEDVMTTMLARGTAGLGLGD